MSFVWPCPRASVFESKTNTSTTPRVRVNSAPMLPTKLSSPLPVTSQLFPQLRQFLLLVETSFLRNHLSPSPRPVSSLVFHFDFTRRSVASVLTSVFHCLSDEFVRVSSINYRPDSFAAISFLYFPFVRKCV